MQGFTFILVEFLRENQIVCGVFVGLVLGQVLDEKVVVELRRLRRKAQATAVDFEIHADWLLDAVAGGSQRAAGPSKHFHHLKALVVRAQLVGTAWSTRRLLLLVLALDFDFIHIFFLLQWNKTIERILMEYTTATSTYSNRVMDFSRVFHRQNVRLRLDFGFVAFDWNRSVDFAVHVNDRVRLLWASVVGLDFVLDVGALFGRTRVQNL